MDYRALAKEMLETMALQKMPMDQRSQMSIGERGILTYLRFVRDGVLAGELSRELGVTTGRIAVALKNLEKKGLIQRSIDERDHRCVIVRITPRGTAEIEAISDYILSSMEDMLCALGEQDAKEYVRIIKRITQIQNESQSRLELDG